VISQTNRPYMGGMNLTRAPFEFTGNRERMGDLLLETDAQVVQLLSSDRRVVVIVQENTLKRFQNLTTGMPLQLLGKSGVWQLYANH